MACQRGDLVCDCSVIYFPDKCGSTYVAVAASVIPSVTGVSIGGRVVCWPMDVRTSDIILWSF